jgi:ferritin-like metal-binding protein YciE
MRGAIEFVEKGDDKMKIETLADLFVEEMQDLYSAEAQLVQALPRMAKETYSLELENAFENHLEQTKEHVRRIEEIFTSMNRVPRSKKCVAMEGLIKEAKELLKENIGEEVQDAALIGVAQRVEHYEIAAYGAAIAHAIHLGYIQAISLLQQTLEEEKATDEKLTMIAERQANEYTKSS